MAILVSFTNPRAGRTAACHGISSSLFSGEEVEEGQEGIFSVDVVVGCLLVS